MDDEKRRAAITVGNLNRMTLSLSQTKEENQVKLPGGYIPPVKPLLEMKDFEFFKFIYLHLVQSDFSRITEISDRMNLWIDVQLPSMRDYENSILGKQNGYKRTRAYSIKEYCFHLTQHLSFQTTWDSYEPTGREFLSRLAYSALNASQKNFYHLFTLHGQVDSVHKSASVSWSKHYRKALKMNTLFEKRFNLTQREIILRNNMDYNLIREDAKTLFNDSFSFNKASTLPSFWSILQKQPKKRKISFHPPYATVFHPAIIEGALLSDKHIILGTMTTESEVNSFSEAVKKANPNTSELFSIKYSKKDIFKPTLVAINKNLLPVYVEQLIKATIEGNVTAISSPDYLLMEYIIDTYPASEVRLMLAAYVRAIKGSKDRLYELPGFLPKLIESTMRSKPNYSEWRALPDFFVQKLFQTQGKTEYKWYLFEDAEEVFLAELIELAQRKNIAFGKILTRV